jgi:ribosome-binding ATPase YchF (GTP1/OBG family)
MLIGLVGAPNSGKSTFFKALTLADVEIANYPFTTIKPNQGVGYVTTECPCSKLGVKCNPQNSKCIEGIRYIPVRLMDVAGLVEGAHLGRGLGNQFLDDLRQASGLIHVLDCSGKTDAEGKPNDWDPEKTIKMLENEIDEWMHGILSKNLDKLKKQAQMEKTPLEKMIAKQLSGLDIKEDEIKEALKEADPESKEFVSILRRISKPILIAANKIDVPETQKNFERLKENYEIMPCSAESELALKEAAHHGLIKYVPGGNDFEIISENLNEKQKSALEFIKKNVLKKFCSTGVQEILNSMAFDVLNQIVVYPVADINKMSDKSNHVLPDAFLVPKGLTLKDFAAKIHSTMADKFIGGIEQKTKKKIGAEYELKDGDIIEIIFGR